jgi:hypothetical protein
MNYTLSTSSIFKSYQTKVLQKAAEIAPNATAVSIQLRNFQDQFEIPLTEIIGEQLYVTDFGKEIAIAANTIFRRSIHML